MNYALHSYLALRHRKTKVPDMKWTALGVGLLLVTGIAVYFVARNPAPDQPMQPPQSPASVKPAPGIPIESDDPTYVPAMTVDIELSPLVNRRLNMAERIRPDMTSSIAEIKHPQDVEPVVQVLKDPKDSDEVRNEAVNLLRRSKHADLTEILIGILNSADEMERFRSFVIQHLGLQAEAVESQERIRIVEVLTASTTDRHVAVRREALLSLVHLKDPSGQATALKWLGEEAELDPVRDLAVRVVREENLRDQLPTIRKLASHTDEPTRIAAVVTLSVWKDEASRAKIVEAAQTTSMRLKRAAQAALARMDAVGEAPSKTSPP